MITAKEAVEKLTNEDAAQIKAAEAKIDEALRKYDGRPICVSFEGANLRQKVLKALCTMYREHGWTADVKYGDQRDPGPWIEFNVSSPPRSCPGM